MCASDILLMANLAYAGAKAEEFTRDLDRQLEESVRKARADAKDSPWLPKPPSGKVQVNPPR